MRPLQEKLLRVRVDVGVMVMKEYSILPRSPELEPRYQVRSHSGVVANVLDCHIVVSEFELHYYVHFRTNTLRKDMNSLIL